MKKSRRARLAKNACAILACLLAAGCLAVTAVNMYVKESVKQQIVEPADAAALDADCIVVLGCQVRDDGTPSLMLGERLERGIELYRACAAKKLLMSGDHGRAEYNEVGTMKRVAVEAGVPSEDVFMDHAGFSTYESMVRAKEVFEAKKIIIVTQKYHLYRALYIAKSLGLEATGVACDTTVYAGQAARDVREVLARCKDFATSLFRPAPTYLGDPVPVSGNGDVTND